MTRYRYVAVFNGERFTRTSEAVYTHASRTGFGFADVVRFHRTKAAARRAAGRYGQVVPVEARGDA